MAVRDMRIVRGFGMTFEQKTGLGTGGLVTPHFPDVLFYFLLRRGRSDYLLFNYFLQLKQCNSFLFLCLFHA